MKTVPFVVLLTLFSFAFEIKAEGQNLEKNNMPQKLKIYSQAYAIEGVEKAIFDVIEFEIDDTLYGRLGKSADTYMLVADQKNPIDKYLHSLYTYINEHGNFCALFPAKLNNLFDDTVRLKIQFRTSDDIWNFSNNSPITEYKLLIQETNSDNIASSQLPPADANWIKENSASLLLNSFGIFEPDYDVDIQNQRVDDLLFLSFKLTDIYNKEYRYFQPRINLFYPPNDLIQTVPDIYGYDPTPEKQLEVVIGKFKCISYFSKLDEYGNPTYCFLYDSFQGVSGKSKIYLNQKLIASNVSIEGNYFKGKKQVEMMVPQLNGIMEMQSVTIATRNWASQQN